MKVNAPTLAPLLRSDLQGSLLAELLLFPDRELSLTQLAETLGAKLTTVHREATRLIESQLLLDRRIGTARLIRANTEHRLYEPTRSLLEVTYGPRPVLESLFASEPKVQEVFIYGSWAARFHGRPGHAPHDVDVLVLGEISGRRLSQLASIAEETLRIPVNMVRMNHDQWAASEDPFVKSVQDAPLVNLRLERYADETLGTGQGRD